MSPRHLFSVCVSLAFSLLAHPLPAEEETHSLSSTHADYDGQTLTLTGQVVLDHGLGTMHAEKAQLQKQTPDAADFPFSQMRLHRNVTLALKNGANVLCTHADLDFNTLAGSLRAEAGEKVRYVDTQKKPLQLLSEQLELHFSKHPGDNHKIDYDVDTLHAQGAVEFHYADDFHLLSDLATYTRTPLTQKVIALPRGPTGLCRLKHGPDTIDATSVDLDLTQEILIAQGPATLHYHDAAKGTESTLLCQGPIHVDRAHLQSTLTSPTVNGEVSMDQQLAYKDDSLTLFADHATIDYAATPLIRPTELTLKGHIRLQTPSRYALADRLHYSLITRTLILSAHPGNKVLFFDAAQQARMSANEVHITQDPETGEQVIRGVGHIRLTLSAEENARLQQLFPQLRISHEPPTSHPAS